MDDFQIVNGCQTSNILYDNRDLLTDAVRVPLRLICTTDDAVKESIITATNRQTAVKVDQFFASKEFSKRLEDHFESYDIGQRIFYERRTHQYDSNSNVPKTRIITHTNLVRAVGGMFFNEPHRSTRNYKQLSSNVGNAIFNDADRLEIYYVSAYAWFLFEQLYKTKLKGELKSARYHILLAARLVMDTRVLPAWNSNDMKRRCEAMTKELWNHGDEIVIQAAEKVEALVGGNLDRDNVRTEKTTDLILAQQT